MHVSRVLLAHRDPVVRELATRTLQHIGVAVDAVVDPSHARPHLNAARYTVIAMQPDPDVLATIAATYTDKRPVVIVTSAADDASALEADIISMVVPEPYDPRTLVGVILACVTPIPPADFSNVIPGSIRNDVEDQ
jgi:DNA-binding response OmpR family regulator